MLRQPTSPTSLFVGALIAVVFCWTYIQDGLHYQSSESCMVAYDQLGYYSYLPAYFIYDDLQFEGEWIETVQANCGQPETYQYKIVDNGNKVNIYHMGLAYLQLPGFLIADQVAKYSDHFERNGVSAPYYVSVRLTAVLFVLLGLFFLRQILLSFFTDKIAAITLLLIYGGTNMFITFFYGELMPHLYLFTLNTIFIYLLLKYYRSKKFHFLLASALILGLTTAIRPTQAIWGVLPLVLLFFQADQKLKALIKLLLFPIAILLFNAPQLFYWKLTSGNWLVLNLHDETLNLLHPYTLDFLFSYKKGWLIYSPLLLFSFVGLYFLFRNNKWMGRAFALFIALTIWVLSSWDCWWYAASFGSRVMVDAYVIFAILLGFFVQFVLRSSRKTILASSFVVLLLTYFSVLQSYQYYKGIIPLSSMTKDHYWYIFGKWNIPQLDYSTLGLNRSELNWPTTLFAMDSRANQLGYRTENSILVDTVQLDFSEKDEYVNVFETPLITVLSTDETLIKCSVQATIPDQTGPVYIAFRLKNRTIYFYEYVLLSPNQTETIHQFNLPIVRSMSDQLKIFVWNPEQNEGTINRLTVNGTSLIR